MIRAHAGWAVLCLAMLPATDARAQESGAVDTRASVEQRIQQLEAQVGGDSSAEKQSVILRWLADLYASAGRLDDAERAYEQILVFFPGDAATTNAYAIFLLEQRHAPERADSVLHFALSWANALPEPPPYIGQTYALRARALRALGRCDEAVAPSETALTMLDEDATEEALRVKAACLAETGHGDEARACYLDLIGVTGGANPDDISAFVALLTAATGSVSADTVRREIAAAIEHSRAERRATAEAEGAVLLEMRADDGARIEATLRRGSTGRAVLFVPEPGSRRSRYTPYAQLLMLDGATTLTVDPRGHGGSRCDSLPDFPQLSETHRGRVADDIATAIRYLRDEEHIPLDRMAVVAAGAACAHVEQAIHEHALSVAVVYLSPVFDPSDLALAASLSFRPLQPTLLLASSEDVYAIQSLGYFIDETHSDQTTTRVFTSAGHGVTLLRDPARYLVMSNWLERALAVGD
ncbi:MAG TPA: tetratricopeptide repeat protein [Candidatus Krumholzibacteria bacterium]|nr:tetratricopeptide repeat protein [Candidatus Krumholzibacteria bacterium]